MTSFLGSIFGGGSSSSVPSTTTSTTSTSPWSGQIPYLTGSATTPGIFSAAQSLYQNTSDYPQYYQSSTYAPLTGGQQTDISGINSYGMAGGNGGINAANGTLASMLSPGYTSGTGGTFNSANPEIANLAGGSLMNSTQPTFNDANSYLSSMINGSTLNPFSAPGFQNVVNNTLANVIPATSASFINGGRSDSGLAEAAQTQAATNAVGGLANQNYLQEQGLQQGAAQQAAQNESLGLNTTLGAGSLASNNLLTQQGNQVKGAAVAPSVDQSQLNDMSTALQSQGMNQQAAQNLLNYQVGDWNYNQALPFNMLSQYQNYVGGTGYGSSSTGSSTSPYYSNTLSNALSGGLGGAALGSALGSAFPETIGAGTGAAAGGGLGLLAAFSDRRLKTDIHRIGESDSGFPLFTYRYKVDAPGTVRIGVMAQDVVKKRPEAVIHTPFGMAVDYGRALAA